MILVSGCNTHGIIPKKCPEDIIPDRLPLDCVEWQDLPKGTPYYACDHIGWKSQYALGWPLLKWKDNITIQKGRAWPTCHTGYKEGENVNRIYCPELYYSKQEISEQGDVLPEEKYKIALVLDFNDGIEEKYVKYHEGIRQNIEINYKRYKIISSSCS